MPKKLSDFPVHLGRGGLAATLPAFTGEMQWYEEYERLYPDDGAEGRLVSLHTFSSPWTMWEMHPKGHELVFCISGDMVLIQELSDGTEQRVALTAGDYAINPPGVWHTADVEGEASVVFITAGEGTRHRQRMPSDV